MKFPFSSFCLCSHKTKQCSERRERCFCHHFMGRTRGGFVRAEGRSPPGGHKGSSRSRCSWVWAHSGGLLHGRIWLQCGMGQGREQTSPSAGEEEEEGYPSQSSRRIKLHLKVSLGCSHAGHQREAEPLSVLSTLFWHLCLMWCIWYDKIWPITG